MLALTEKVILAALHDWDELAVNGAPIKLAVNTPVSALVKLPIAQMLREERRSAAHWPGLILEVTEDELVNDINLANDVANELRAHQCALAIDDFGAGYSSLARLRQLPFSELKIDRAYVTACDHDRTNADVVEVIVELAHAGSASRPWPKASRPRMRATSCRASVAMSGRAICSQSRWRRRNSFRCCAGAPSPIRPSLRAKR